MGTGIDGPPNEYEAGLGFDYSVWTPGTTVDIVNVSWNNDYRDVVRFANRAELDSYISSLPKVTVTNMSYAKPNEDIYLQIPFNAISRYNYIRASNPLMPIQGDIQKNYYYFIIGCEYVTPNNTRLRLQLDAWSTYIDDITFGNCYVERGHIGIANEQAFWNYGRDYLTVPEGLDVGSDLQITQRYSEDVITAGSEVIAVASTVDLTADAGTVSAPKLVTAKGGRALGVPSGASIYLFNGVSSFSQWLSANQDKAWVTQGIISATIIPDPSRYGTVVSWQPSGTPTVCPSGMASTVHDMNFRNNWRDDVKTWIPERYRHLLKFLVSPYLGVELTTMQGNAINIRPELWANDNLEFRETANLIPPNQKLSVYPKGYNAYSASSSAYPSEETSFATHMGNFPTLSVVNNMAIGYLASNRNSILYGQVSADWAQQRALAMAAGAYNVAGGAMSTAADIANIGIVADMQQTGINNRLAAAQGILGSVGGFVGGVGTALTPGGFGGSAIQGTAQAVVQAGNTVTQINANDQSLAVRNAQNADTANRQIRQSGLSRDTNYELAQFAAKGDYANALAGINAKVQDAKLIQPTVSGQQGGDILNYLNNWLEVRITIKRADGSATRILGEFWLRYGYAIRAFITPPSSLMVMSKFTYWKMLETYIASSKVPEGHKQVIRGILEKGVTVWKNPADIGVIDIADNQPLTGVSY